MIALSTGHGPLEPGFEFAAAAGVSALELACQEPENRPGCFDDTRIATVRGLVEHFGMTCVVHSASAVNCAETDPTVRPAVVAHLLEYVDLTDRLGLDTLIVHAGYHFGLGLDEPLDALARTLGEVAARAHDRGITMVLENMNVLPAEAEIRYLGCTAAEVLAILDSVDSPALEACLDVGHAHLLPGGVSEFVEVLAPRIAYVQLTDNDGVVDDHLALGQGTLDVAAAFDVLGRAGYDGLIGIELHDPTDRMVSLRYLRSIGLT